MRSCPQCHLLLEPMDWSGGSLQACRSCGGIWLRPEEIATGLGSERAGLLAFIERLPGAASAETFAGLARPCPDCRTALLADGPVPGAEETCAAVCPRCGGAWLDAGARASIRRTMPAPSSAPQPEAPALQLQSPTNVTVSQASAGDTNTGLSEPVGTLAPRPDGATVPLPFVLPDTTDVLEANGAYARAFRSSELPREPARSIVVLTCMDSRIPVLEMLGLKVGDAHVLRNAGGLATDDALRSILISHHLMGTQEFCVVGHTDCGMTRFTDEELLEHLAAETGISDATPNEFLAFGSVLETVRDQVMRIKMHPWLEGRVNVRGFIYDVETGRLTETA